jgi:uncharacterized alpha-E superfamily protein
VISRVADHCFWFGRYVDRAESTARLLQVTRSLVFDADIPVTQCWQPLVIVSGAYPVFVEKYGAAAVGDGEVVQDYATWSLDNLVSLRRSVSGARESARVIRDVLSLETWTEVNELYLWLGSEAAERLYREDREAFYRRVRRGTQLILGLVRSTMLHDTPMSFLWLGTMLERVGQTARILDMHHHTLTIEAAGAPAAHERPVEKASHQIVEMALWLSLLRACSGYEAFVKKFQGRVTAAAVVSFLLYDVQFPRSLRYCLRSSGKILEDIWPTTTSLGQVPVGLHSQRRLQDLVGWVEMRAAAVNPPEPIHDLLTHVVDQTAAICSDIGQEILGPPREEKVAAPEPEDTVPPVTQTQTQRQVVVRGGQ